MPSLPLSAAEDRAIAAILLGHNLDSPILAPALVIAALRAPVPEWLARWAGEISYPLYLVHFSITWSLVWVLGGTVGAVIFAGSVALVLAACINCFAERPIRAWLRQRLPRG